MLIAREGPARGVSLLSALAYADLFDSPMTAGELAIFQVWVPERVDTRIDNAEIAGWLAQEVGPDGRLSLVGDYYCLRGREAIVETRSERARVSAAVWPKARIRKMAIRAALRSNGCGNGFSGRKQRNRATGYRLHGGGRAWTRGDLPQMARGGSDDEVA